MSAFEWGVEFSVIACVDMFSGNGIVPLITAGQITIRIRLGKNIDAATGNVSLRRPSKAKDDSGGSF